MHIPLELQLKFRLKSCRALFMGYPDGVKGYRLWGLLTGTFFVARDVIFNENVPTLMPDSDSNEEEGMSPSSPLPDTAPPSDNPAVGTSPSSSPRCSGHECKLTEKGAAWVAELAVTQARLDALTERREQVCTGVSSPDTTDASLRAIDELRKVESDLSIPSIVANVVIEEQAHIMICSDHWRDPTSLGYDLKIPPAMYDEAVKHPDKEEWMAAITKELQTMKDMAVYKVSKLPEGSKAIGCQWVLEVKEDNKGGSVYKARLVAQGFSQVPRVNYGATFAPIIKPTSVRLLVALACQHDWEVHTFDTKRAFLWGVLKEEIYMRQPKAFKDGDWCIIIWLMLHTIYGLKQSALEWYHKVCGVMLGLGFHRTKMDHVLFYYDEVSSTADQVHTRCFVGWHIDDGMAALNNLAFLIYVKKCIADRFGLTDLGLVTKYLGVQFKRDRPAGFIWLHQAEYVHLFPPPGI